jgi:hypothetical protein
MAFAVQQTSASAIGKGVAMFSAEILNLKSEI